MNFDAHKGAIAFCSRGELGLITSETPVEVTYKLGEICYGMHLAVGDGCHAVPCDCVKGIAWVGIHMSPEKMGQPWSSRRPRVVGQIRPASSITLDGTGRHDKDFYVVEGRRESRAYLEL